MRLMLNRKYNIKFKIKKQKICRMFDTINSMKIIFPKTGELNGSNYDKIPLRSSAILIIEIIDKYCSLSSFLAYCQPFF